MLNLQEDGSKLEQLEKKPIMETFNAARNQVIVFTVHLLSSDEPKSRFKCQNLPKAAKFLLSGLLQEKL